MRYAHSIFIGVLLCAILIACKTSTGSFPTPEKLVKSDDISEGIDKESLTRGRALAVTECAGCHRFYFPREYSPSEWNRIIRKKAKRLSLGKEQIADINLYFQTASRAVP
jgi:hypothetical protein